MQFYMHKHSLSYTTGHIFRHKFYDAFCCQKIVKGNENILNEKRENSFTGLYCKLFNLNAYYT